MSDRNDLSRRDVLQGTAAAGLAATGAFAFDHRQAHAQGAFNWQRFKGEKIEVSLVKSPRGDLLQKHQKEFEDMTGIKVGAEQIPEQQHRQKQVIEFTSGRPSFDVTTTAWHVQKRLFAKGKWLEDLRPMLADATMTAPDIDRSDYLKAGMGYATESDGRISSMPLQIDYFIL
jgi:multiple sugar transport system substrate-binding protein